MFATVPNWQSIPLTVVPCTKFCVPSTTLLLIIISPAEPEPRSAAYIPALLKAFPRYVT